MIDEHGQQQLFAVAQQQFQLQPVLGGQHARHGRRARIGEKVPAGNRVLMPATPAGEVEEDVLEAALLDPQIGGQDVPAGTQAVTVASTCGSTVPSTRYSPGLCSVAR